MCVGRAICELCKRQKQDWANRFEIIYINWIEKIAEEFTSKQCQLNVKCIIQVPPCELALCENIYSIRYDEVK